MSDKRSKYIGWIAILVLFLGIVFFNYSENKKIYNSVPSQKWSKEVVIGNGNSKNSPKFIKKDNKIILGYDNLNEVKISSIDNLGKKEVEKTYKIDEDFLLGTSFTKVKDGYVFAYNSTTEGKPYMGKVYLNEDLEKIDEKKEENITNIVQLDDNLVVLSDESKIIVRNTEKESEIKLDVKNASNIAVCKLKDKYMICFVENKSELNSVLVENGQFKDRKLVLRMSQSGRINYDNFACSSDGTFGYVILEERNRGEYTGTDIIPFKLQGNEVGELKKLTVNGYNEVYNNIGLYSEEGERFMGTIPINKQGDKEQETIVDYVIENGEIKSFDNVSRLREMCISPYVQDDVIAYLSYNKEDNYNINIASTNDQFKSLNNGVRSEDSKLAINHTIEQIAYAISYILIIGLHWCVPALFLCAVVSFFDYKIKVKGKFIAFISIGALVIGLKSLEMYRQVYAINRQLPAMLSNATVGIIICAVISLVSYMVGYNRCKRDEESPFIANFGIALLIDTILTLILFTPYIYV